jgi:DNA polymerase
VFGEGNAQADLLFIAEAPGRDEDLAGKPFVGVGGTLFERMLASIGIQRDDVYMMHGVKCRPQHNRDPKPVEFAACESFLTAQVEHVQPKVICMLGRVVAQTLLKTDASLKELRAGRFSYRGIPVLVIDHPSYLLRAQQNKRRAWQDLCRLQSFLQTIH